MTSCKRCGEDDLAWVHAPDEKPSPWLLVEAASLTEDDLKRNNKSRHFDPDRHVRHVCAAVEPAVAALLCPHCRKPLAVAVNAAKETR